MVAVVVRFKDRGLSPAIHSLPPGLWLDVLGPLLCPIILGLTPPIILGLAVTNGAFSLGEGDALPPTRAT